MRKGGKNMFNSFGRNIVKTFGTPDLDLVIEQYAPDFFDRVVALKNNQQVIYDKLKEQDKWLSRIEAKLDHLSETLKK